MKKTYRIKKEKEFQQIITERRSYANRNFVVYCTTEDAQNHFRVGISVGKRVGNAVVRNAVKRKIRTILYQLREDIAPCNFIIIARAGVQDLDFEALQKNIIHVLKLAQIMK